MTVIKSFKFAFEGLRDALLHERNFRIQVVVFIIVIIAGFSFQINSTEWIFILLCAAVVLSTEIINSAIEKLCNFVSPEIHPLIKKIKDFSAAAVLVGTILSVIIGAIIFLPKIMVLIFR
ncbi:MAG: diacylglycerol kinase family protein [Ginsengibacter sp.]|jgi:diacylglycerol kinase